MSASEFFTAAMNSTRVKAPDKARYSDLGKMNALKYAVRSVAAAPEETLTPEDLALKGAGTQILDFLNGRGAPETKPSSEMESFVSAAKRARQSAKPVEGAQLATVKESVTLACDKLSDLTDKLERLLRREDLTEEVSNGLYGLLDLTVSTQRLVLKGHRSLRN